MIFLLTFSSGFLHSSNFKANLIPFPFALAYGLELRGAVE